MSALTKVFVVLLVVLSLLLAAASVTFLNTVPAYGTRIDSLDAQLRSAQTAASSSAAREAANRSALERQRDELNNLLANAQQALIDQRAQLANSQAEKATLQSQVVTAQTGISQAIAALNANQSVVETLQAQVGTLRDENRDAFIDRNETARQLVDAENELEYARKVLNRLEEQNAELLSSTEQIRRVAEASGMDLSTTPPVPPRINGVITDSRQLPNGRYGSISVGSEDDVQPGVRFAIFDSESKAFLGFLDVESVDDSESFGKLTGPGVNQISAGDEARTDI